MRFSKIVVALCLIVFVQFSTRPAHAGPSPESLMWYNMYKSFGHGYGMDCRAEGMVGQACYECGMLDCDTLMFMRFDPTMPITPEQNVAEFACEEGVIEACVWQPVRVPEPQPVVVPVPVPDAERVRVDEPEPKWELPDFEIPAWIPPTVVAAILIIGGLALLASYLKPEGTPGWFTAAAGLILAVVAVAYVVDQMNSMEMPTVQAPTQAPQLPHVQADAGLVAQLDQAHQQLQNHGLALVPAAAPIVSQYVPPPSAVIEAGTNLVNGGIDLVNEGIDYLWNKF